MNDRTANNFDATGDMYEIGLMAAASPEFMEALLRALLASGPDVGAADEPAGLPAARVAA